MMLKLTLFAKLVSEDEFELNFNIDAKKNSILTI